MSSTRPIMTAGPMGRKVNPLSSGSVVGLGGGSGGAPPPRPCAQIIVEAPKHARAAADRIIQRRLEDDRDISFSLRLRRAKNWIRKTLSQTTGGRRCFGVTQRLCIQRGEAEE